MKRVRTKWVSRIEETGRVLVEAGERVLQGKLLATSRQRVVTSFKVLKVAEWQAKWMGKRVAEGQVLCESGGWRRGKIICPGEGVIVGIDELGNVLIEKEVEKEVLAPAEAKVSKIDKEKITLEFEAVEFKGRGVTGGKVWGNIWGQEIGKMADLSSRLTGKIILMLEINTALLTKAEVVGVAGVITRAYEGEMDDKVCLPVLSLGEKEWEELKKILNNTKKDLRAMINSLKDRLLLVVN